VCWSSAATDEHARSKATWPWRRSLRAIDARRGTRVFVIPGNHDILKPVAQGVRERAPVPASDSGPEMTPDVVRPVRL